MEQCVRWSHWTTERTRTIGPFRGCQSTGATYGTFQQCMQCVEIHTNAGNQFANNLRCGPALCTRHTRTGDAERATTALLCAPFATVRVCVCYMCEEVGLSCFLLVIHGTRVLSCWPYMGARRLGCRTENPRSASSGGELTWLRLAGWSLLSCKPV